MGEKVLEAVLATSSCSRHLNSLSSPLTMSGSQRQHCNRAGALPWTPLEFLVESYGPRPSSGQESRLRLSSGRDPVNSSGATRPAIVSLWLSQQLGAAASQLTSGGRTWSAWWGVEGIEASSVVQVTMRLERWSPGLCQPFLEQLPQPLLPTTTNVSLHPTHLARACTLLHPLENAGIDSIEADCTRSPTR